MLKKILAILFGLLSSLFIFLIFEITFKFMLEKNIPDFTLELINTKKQPLKDRERIESRLKSELGFFLPPSSEYQYKFTLENKIIWDTKYKIDEYGRRVTPFDDHEAKKHLLFFGGSFVFGHGVGERETFPFYVAENLKELRPYNYGMDGHAPNHMLSRLQSMIKRSHVKEEKGLLIYCFLDFHFLRILGVVSALYDKGSGSPYYFLDDKEKLKREGSFYNGRKGLTKLYLQLGKSSFLNFFGLEIPFRFGDYAHAEDKEIKLAAEIFKESYEIYKDKFNSKNFVVVFFPDGEEGLKTLSPYLKNYGIKYLDYTKAFNKWSLKDLYFPYNGHPKPVFYRILAEKFSRDIKKLI